MLKTIVLPDIFVEV